MTESRWNEIMKIKNENCNNLSKEIKQLLKVSGLDVSVRKYNERRIEIKCFLNTEKTKQVIEVISKNHPDWKFESELNDFYANNICISIL